MVTAYVTVSGVRGSAWNSVVKDILILAIVLFLGIYLPLHYYGGFADMFRAIDTARPGFLSFPAKGSSVIWFQSTVLLTALGFFMWPHSFGSIFTAKNERIFRRNAMVLPLYQLILLFVFFVGPTVYLLTLIPSTFSTYISEFLFMTGQSAAWGPESAEFSNTWTVYYWAWWLSWSPFVGMFLARISRGRSVREFCLGVLLIPAGVSTLWFAIFGGTAIHMEQNGESITGESAEEELFNLLQSMPGGFVAGIVAAILLATFFVTSADSASTVMGSMSQNGAATAKPWLSAAWGGLTALVGLTLLLANEDALSNLQNVTIVAALPFLFIVVGLMFAIYKALSEDVIYLEYREAQQFQRKMARERRLHRDYQRTQVLKKRRNERLKNPMKRK